MYLFSRRIPKSKNEEDAIKANWQKVYLAHEHDDKDDHHDEVV